MRLLMLLRSSVAAVLRLFEDPWFSEKEMRNNTHPGSIRDTDLVARIEAPSGARETSLRNMIR